MARRLKLGDALKGVDPDDQLAPATQSELTTDPAPDATAPVASSTTPDSASTSAAVADHPGDPRPPAAVPPGPRKGGASAGAGTASKPAKKTSQKKTAGSRPAGSDGEPEVRTVSTQDGKKVSIYLHPDDYRDLQFARAEDGADFQARFRSMLAVWRTDQRVKAKINRLAANAPRGGQGG